jgi:hypothetical protein
MVSKYSQCVDSQHGDNEPIVSCRRMAINKSQYKRGEEGKGEIPEK